MCVEKQGSLSKIRVKCIYLITTFIKIATIFTNRLVLPAIYTAVTNCKTMATTLAEKLIQKMDRYTNFEMKFDKNFRIAKTVIFCAIKQY